LNAFIFEGRSEAGDAIADETDVEKAAAPSMRGAFARIATRNELGTIAIILQSTAWRVCGKELAEVSCGFWRLPALGIKRKSCSLLTGQT
jgi:hypothetical protein